jgi:hypothetical protein
MPTLTFDAVRSQLVRVACEATLDVVTNDPDYVDDETRLGDDDLRASKIGGAPALTAKAQMPACGKCKAPLGFMAQLRRDDVPEAFRPLFPTTMVQLFACDACFPTTDKWNKVTLVRDIAVDDVVGEVAPRGADDDETTVRFIRSWQAGDDFPPCDADALARALAIKPLTAARREELEELANEMSDVDDIHRFSSAFKLGGWPGLAEAKAFRCTCKATMTPLLHLAEHLTHGDGRSVWLARCPSCAAAAVVAHE